MRWLVIGGTSAQGRVGTLWIWDPRTGTYTATGASLQVPRAGHTATLLPTGIVWVYGGVDATGTTVAEAEDVDPDTWQTVATTPTGLTPRTKHTATVLSDGRVLLAGGTGPDGRPLPFTTAVFTTEGIPAAAEPSLCRPRRRRSRLARP